MCNPRPDVVKSAYRNPEAPRRDNAQMNTILDKQRFCRLWSHSSGHSSHGEAQDAAADDIFEALATHYREPHRHYHTGGHINDCLSRMDLAKAALGHSASVELAIWFHDVIYLTGDPENERKSADWFAEKAAGVLSPEMIREVDGYIMSTLHREKPDDEGAKFVVDVDLSGLGMAPESFKRDGDNIRKEFGDMSEIEFIRGQAGFLQKLLDRDSIYFTPFFYDLCEAPARRNIRGVLDSLR